MGLRTADEYKEGLRDNRDVWILGERVEDVTTHPMLRVGIETAAIDYEMAERDDCRDLAVVEHAQTGEYISRHYYLPHSSEDLLKRHDLIVTGTRLGDGMIPFTKDVAGDCLNAIWVTTQLMGKDEYLKRITDYYEHVRKRDLSIACGMSDVKGDRSLHPSSKEQAHPDFYVRVVDRNSDGITVRGAKVHITASAYSDDILVLPCRAMREEDRDYALCFSVPANANGLKHICHPIRYQYSPQEFPVDLAVRMHTEALLVFDDVFIPWEKVFLCGEWQFAGNIAYSFSFFHRHTASCYRIAMTELQIGMAQAIAEYNGLEGASHVREKITDMIIYLEMLKSLARASCSEPIEHGGIAVPNPIISNISKYHFAENYHTFVKSIQDICGGILVTSPTYRDYQNPELRDYIDKYLGGRKGIPTEHRLRMLQLIRTWIASDTGGGIEVTALHAEGSLQAQRMIIYGEYAERLQEYKENAKRLAGIE
jgi:4-hydroxybutyryl-CoA dehydratase/vinylacetyl-CoA-Delta-isomerase